LLTACSAFALASCGGDQKEVERRTETWPTIEASVANRLADRSDAVAGLLDRGDTCGAAEEAARLRAQVTAAISSIPDIYVEDFSGLVNEIQAQIPPCEQPPSDDKKDDDQDDGTKEKKKKKKSKNEDDE
jgi:hypothetical protein